MKKKNRAILKKEIRKILKEFEWKSEHSEHSELAEFILDMIEEF